MKAEEILQKTRVVVNGGTFSVVKARALASGCFAAMADGREITLVQRSEEVDPANAIAEEPGWRILTFDAVLPFGLTGFLAIVAGRLAAAGIPIFALSAYSTDHILVKETDLEGALHALGNSEWKNRGR